MNERIEQGPKPERLYKKSYLQLLRNSVGSNMFRSFYVRTDQLGEFDALGGGQSSCAFYVSGVLTMFNKIKGVHGTVANTEEDMVQSGWFPVLEEEIQEGDVVVWSELPTVHGQQAHIGFYIGDDRAISASSLERTIVEHDLYFGDVHRGISRLYRTDSWSDEPG